MFCCLNSKYIHSSLAPWCIYTSSKLRCLDGIECEVVEGTVNEADELVLNRIMSVKPDAVAFSCYIWNIGKVLSLSSDIKKLNSDTVIILGGPEASYRQREILENYTYIDYVISGEGEITVPELLNGLFSGKPSDIPAVSYRTADGLHIDGRPAPTDESISPYCEEYFRSLNGRIAYIESSRGCPFNCAFCLSGRLGKVRYIDIDRVKKEMIQLSQAGAKTVKFVDRTFNCNKSGAGEILSFIKEQYGKNILCGTCFHFELAADLLDGALFDIISDLPVGAVQFEIGIQSFNEATLRKINRKTDIGKVIENIKRLIALGNCHVHIDLIAGLPEENLQSFTDGFNKAYALGANMLQLGFLKLLPGAPMTENPDKFPCTYNSEPPYEVISTPWITDEELKRLHVAENELDRLYNSGRFSMTLDYIFSVCGMTPFDAFIGLGDYLSASGKGGSLPLDEYVNIVYDYFSSVDGVNRKRLRDVMIYDRIATNNSGVIPDRLKVMDSDMKKIRNLIREFDPPEGGCDRTVAVLYTENKAVYCDYKKRNPVTGRYEVKEYMLESR